MWLPWVISMASTLFFGSQLLVTMRERDRAEEERDALWDELHGMTRQEWKP